jgi:acetolactate synthase-1/3 small subunit
MQWVTLALLMDDEPSALGRLFSVLRQRKIQLGSATIAPAQQSGTSRVTLRVNTGELSSSHLARYLNRIVSVHKLVIADEAREEPLEIAIIVLSPSNEAMIHVMAHLQKGVTVRGVRNGAVTVEASGTSSFIDDFIAGIDPASILETTRSGPVVTGLRETARRPAVREAVSSTEGK